MGIGSSTVLQLRENEYLKRLSSTSPITENDPFWNQLFSFTLTTSKNRPGAMLLEEATVTFCESLFANNQRTGNFTSLVKVFLSRATELKSSSECEDEIFLWQSRNALYIIQHLCKFLVENMTEDKMIEQFEACSLDERKKELSSGSVFEEADHSNHLLEFVTTLMNIIIEVPALKHAYTLHMEALNCLIILLSVQIFIPSPSHDGPMHKLFFGDVDASKINQFIHALFLNFIEQRPSPETDQETQGGGSFVFGLAYSVASGLKTVLRMNSNSKSESIGSLVKVAPLAHMSALMILVLINHHTKIQYPNKYAGENTYRDAVHSFRHLQGRQKGVTSGKAEISPSFHINLSRLYTTLCSTQAMETSTLLLYSLLHGNADVKAYVLSKTDVECLVLPILEILYIAPTQNSHHIYMALIVLLILTEDDHFNKSVHEISLSVVPWFTDRILKNVTLGDVIILILLRIIQFNMYQVRDRYLHTNCLAALANMSSHFRSIHSYAAQRIFELLTSLTKRHKQYLQKISLMSGATDAPIVDGSSCTTIESERDYVDDVHVLEEVIRMLLEIVNSCFTSGILRHNSNLVYAMLQKRDAFDQLKKHQQFQDVLQNIKTIILFFTERLNQKDEQALTVEEVHQIINDATVQLPSHYLHKFPELKFRYIEEESPEDFFVPYVWSLAFNKSGIFWNPGCVQLFSLEL